jgi:hypothetical protein
MAGSLTPVTAAAQTPIQRLVEKGMGYWLSVLGVLALSILATPYVEDYLNLAQAKYWVFQKLIDLTWSPPLPRFVKVVLVGDDEYWQGYPAGRRPIKRDYLAQIVDPLDFANAALSHLISMCACQIRTP